MMNNKIKKAFELVTYVIITVLGILSGTFIACGIISGNAADWACAAVSLGFAGALVYFAYVISETPEESE